MTSQDYANRISQLIQDHEAEIGAEWIGQLEALTVRSNAVSKDQLRKHCQARLDAAQLRIERIVAGPDGTATGTQPFDDPGR